MLKYNPDYLESSYSQSVSQRDESERIILPKTKI